MATAIEPANLESFAIRLKELSDGGGHESHLTPERLKAIRSVQRRILAKLPKGVSLVDELLAARRVEAEREIEGH